MVGHAAEQIIAGVVLSERLAVTMYGAIHRASFNGQRNLRGLVVDAKFLADDPFRQALTDTKTIDRVTQLDHGAIVPTFTVESNGPDVVVVTRGVGRYVTVQDLIESAKARGRGGRLATPLAALIGTRVIEGLAYAHGRGVIHGAVHPRSVIVDEDGAVRLDGFVVGRALTTAVAAGADSSLWRGHAGYIAPELVVGEDPTPGSDVFAVGAMLFAMLTGDVPPGTLRATPAVERLIQRALDTDAQRRYRTAADLLENFQEALEDDRWELADRAELVSEAGLLGGDTNLDDATEDLLASLGSAAVSVTPTRPSMDMRAEAVVQRQKQAMQQAATGGQSTGGRLDALLSDLTDEHTGVDDPPFQRDPVSELINLNPRKREVIVSSTRVPSLDDPDDETPLPPPVPTRESDMSIGRPSRGSGMSDEAAALAAIGDLDQSARRVSTASEQAATAATKLEQAAARAERAASRVETGKAAKVDVDDDDDTAVPKAKGTAKKPALATPVLAPDFADAPPAKLKSPLRGVLGGILVLGALGAAGYGIYARLQSDDAQARAAKEQRERDEKASADRVAAAREALPDPGSLEIDSEGAGIWLLLGKTPVDTAYNLPATQQHDLVLMHDGQEPTFATVGGPQWSGTGAQVKASIAVPLKPGKGGKPAELPLQPTSQVLATTGVAGQGKLHVESTPADAEAWLFIGANHARMENLIAGRDYTVAVVKPGFKTARVDLKADDWRDNDPQTPIDSAKKKAVLSRTVELEPAKAK